MVEGVAEGATSEWSDGPEREHVDDHPSDILERTSASRTEATTSEWGSFLEGVPRSGAELPMNQWSGERSLSRVALRR